MPRAALVVVDVQNDFLPGGSLPVSAGNDVVPVLNRYIERFLAAGLPIVATRDWHPTRTVHFAEFGGRWPVHCVQGTRGAEFSPQLSLPASTLMISKGTREDEDAYSGFQGRDGGDHSLAEALHSLGATQLYLGGLATDYCVSTTVLDGLKAGFAVTVLADAVRGINLEPGDIDRAMEAMVRAGAVLTTLERITLASATDEGAGEARGKPV